MEMQTNNKQKDRQIQYTAKKKEIKTEKLMQIMHTLGILMTRLLAQIKVIYIYIYTYTLTKITI